MPLTRSALALTFLSLCPAAAASQDVPADTSPPNFKLERSVGFSWISTGGNAGRVTGRRVYVAELRWTSHGLAKGPVELAYTLDLVPLIVVERTEPNRLICFDQVWRTLCHRDASVRVAAGAGGSPIGATLLLNRGGSTRLRFGSALGMMVFSSDVPIYNSRRLNFRYEYGFGLERDLKGGRALSFGYKFFHVSNAGMGQYNPGLDANVLYVGLAKGNTRKP
jgi:hypothetical protein